MIINNSKDITFPTAVWSVSISSLPLLQNMKVKCGLQWRPLSWEQNKEEPLAGDLRSATLAPDSLLA